VILQLWHQTSISQNPKLAKSTAGIFTLSLVIALLMNSSAQTSDPETTLTIPNPLCRNPNHKQSEDTTFNILHCHLLASTLNEFAVEGSFEEWRMKADNVLGDFEGLCVLACTSVDLDVGLFSAVGC
jgi:hypothetical protein